MCTRNPGIHEKGQVGKATVQNTQNRLRHSNRTEADTLNAPPLKHEEELLELYSVIEQYFSSTANIAQSYGTGFSIVASFRTLGHAQTYAKEHADRFKVITKAARTDDHDVYGGTYCDSWAEGPDANEPERWIVKWRHTTLITVDKHHVYSAPELAPLLLPIVERSELKGDLQEDEIERGGGGRENAEGEDGVAAKVAANGVGN